MACRFISGIPFVFSPCCSFETDAVELFGTHVPALFDIPRVVCADVAALQIRIKSNGIH